MPLPIRPRSHHTRSRVDMNYRYRSGELALRNSSNRAAAPGVAPGHQRVAKKTKGSAYDPSLVVCPVQEKPLTRHFRQTS